MADVREKVEQIRQAVYGKEVRESIASGIEAINTDIDALNDLVDALDSRVDTIITTPISGEAAAQEIVDARVSTVKEKTFATLDARFEETEQDIATHKANNVQQIGGVHGLEIETGTFTPYLYGSTIEGSPIYSSQRGSYIKIGKRVFIDASLNLTSKSDISGNVRVGGLPYPISAPGSSGNPNFAIGNIGHVIYGDAKGIGVYGFNGMTYLAIYKYINSANAVSLTDADINNSFSIYLSGSYSTL